jgi:glycosyltransferase involved in cell wall biosynthesis
LYNHGISEARPLRVAFYLPHFNPGGIERVVLNALKNMNQKRVVPTLILRQRRGSFLPEIPESVPVLDLGGTKSRWVVRALRGCLRKHRFDVVYSGTNAANLVLLAATRLMRGRPKIIISEHTSAELYLSEAKWRPLRLLAMKCLYPKADLVVTPHAELGEELRVLLKVPNLPVREILNPLYDETQVRSHNRDDSDEGPVKSSSYFVAAGRLAKVKGYDLLIKSFQQILQYYPHLHLRLLGDGEERDSLDSLVHDLSLEGHVHFEGFVKSPIDYFLSGIALVVSSHREGTPNVIPEAMSIGLPVIARDCSVGVRRLVRDGEAGILIRGAEPGDLLEGMLAVLNNPEQRRKLVEAGYVQARKFSFQRTIPRLEQAFLDAYYGDVVRGAAITSEL